MLSQATQALGVLLFVSAQSACGGSSATRTAAPDLDDFACNDRSVEYMVVGGFVAEEAGISMHCAESGPTILKWSLDNGERKENTHVLSAQQFDDVWEKIDSTGWRHLQEECENPEEAPDDPAYVMDVGDHAMSTSFSCSGKTLPFPFDRIVNELDLRAAGFGDQDHAPR